MSRPVTLFTGQWADLTMEDLAKKVSDSGPIQQVATISANGAQFFS